MGINYQDLATKCPTNKLAEKSNHWQNGAVTEIEAGQTCGMPSVACGNLHTFLRLSILNNFLKENVPGKRRKRFFILFFHSSYSESQTSGIFWCYQDCMIQISQLSLEHYMCLKFKSVQGRAVFSCSSSTQQMEPEGSGVWVHP